MIQEQNKSSNVVIIFLQGKTARAKISINYLIFVTMQLS